MGKRVTPENLVELKVFADAYQSRGWAIGPGIFVTTVAVLSDEILQLRREVAELQQQLERNAVLKDGSGTTCPLV